MSKNSPNIILCDKRDPLFPKSLKDLPDCPEVLFFRGDLTPLSSPSLAVVGSRKMSSYAHAILPEILKPVCEAGVTIVSGLAYGVDSWAHEIALNARGKTIAVLGSGIDDATIYPKAHVNLALRVIQTGGAIVSEYPEKTPGFKHHFIARNRIIAGLAQAVLIVECAEKSGTLITVNFALDYNRDVMAIPGAVNAKNSEGSNKLIKNGALVVTEAQDLLDYFGLQISTTKKAALSPFEAELLQLLKQSPRDIDSLTENSILPIEKILVTLSELEIKGLVRKTEAQDYMSI